MKLRIWDSDNQIFEYIDLTDLEKTISIFDCYRDYFWSGYLKDNPEYLQKYTGFQDKNKKDIYEGDFIEVINDANQKIVVQCMFGTIEREIMGSELNNCYITGFYYFFKGKATLPIVTNYLGISDYEIFEVVGNVFETKK